MKKMRVFAGKHVLDVAGQSQRTALFIVAASRHDWATKVGQSSIALDKGCFIMRSAKAIATWASVAAVACSIFVFSWVGLALLGF
jgi:hypothetical protein